MSKKIFIAPDGTKLIRVLDKGDTSRLCEGCYFDKIDNTYYDCVTLDEIECYKRVFGRLKHFTFQKVSDNK